MYKAFYGFQERPFAKTPDPRYLYLSRSHREALARLLHAVEERELILLVGEIGCGKTTLSRALLDELDEQYQVVVLTNPRLSPFEFLQTLALRLGIAEPGPSKATLLEQLGAKLYSLYRQQHHPVLLIDEAQLIPHRDLFDEIRLLTNFQLDEVNLISVVLMGQPELLKRLAHPVYEPLRQRVGIQYALGPLQAEEIGPYLQHRLLTAGCQAADTLFSAEAIAEIGRFSKGVPRRINQLASLALLEGFGRQQAQIDVAIVAAVAEELIDL